MCANPLRHLPSVSELLESPPLKHLMNRISRSALVTSVVAVLDEVGHEIKNVAVERSFPSVTDLAARIARRIMEGQPPTLRPVINATGLLLDKRFGYPPLAEEAVVEMAAVAKEYIDSGNDTESQAGVGVEKLLQELTNAEASIVVNSHPAAVMLAVTAIANAREIVVSRGQLGEIVTGCSLADLISLAGAKLCEVGATNKTRTENYVAAISKNTAAIMLVDAADFTLIGASESPCLIELVSIGHHYGIPLIHNIGCGTLVDLSQYGIHASYVIGNSVKNGADIVICSGDKLIGGPQCGIILGRKPLIEKIEQHPLYSVFCIDKLGLAGLAATLRIYRDAQRAQQDIPLLSLLTTSTENLKYRAERIALQAQAVSTIAEATVVPDTTVLGHDILPLQTIPTWCVAIRPANTSVQRFGAMLQNGVPAVVGKIKDNCVLLDLRSVFPRQDMEIVAALEATAGQKGDF